jgi:hypothetical protein
MPRAQILTMQFFRLKPGDVGIGNRPGVGEADLTSAKQATANALASYFNEPRRQPHLKPHHARLLAENGSIIAEFEMRPDGVREIPARA